MIYNPANWYWLADDGRVFASERSIIVAVDDDGYKDFVNRNGSASRWPSDTEGEQTTAALQDVLTPHDLFVDLTAYAEYARWKKEVSGLTFSGLVVLTDDRSKQMIMGARVSAENDDTFTTNWVTADGTIVTLTAAQTIDLSNAVLARVNGCFSVYATVKAGIDDQTITTQAQIDTAFAAVT